MNQQPPQAPNQELSRLQGIGILIFIALCGFPAMEMTGFGFGLPITLPIALLCAIIGGAVGGAMVCPRPIAAGLIGGLIAGPVGLVAIFLYTLNRQEVWNVELALVQGIASLPGVGVGILIKKLLAADPQAPNPYAADDQTADKSAQRS